tara:strand:+ start:201 stop:827 length:627 start_codon:yes stop_codon:yes gene_type:complete
VFDKTEVIDNFLTEEDFKELSTLKLDDVRDKEKRVYHNRIYKDGKIESSCIESKTIKRLHSNYHSIAIKILKKYAPQKVELYQYSDFHIVIAGSNYSFPIHSDTPNKLLSGVVYLAPEKNFGTILYSPNKKESKNIEWKENRALFFSRTENTPHSYKSDSISDRITLIYNLMTVDIKSVCKVEKTFYPYVYLKLKMNKYLLKYFNLSI